MPADDEDNADAPDDNLEDPFRTNAQPSIYNSRMILDHEREIPASEAHRIVGRDDHLNQIANSIGSLFQDDPTNDVVLKGISGTGKTMLARHSVARLEQSADNHGTDLVTLYVGCYSAPDTNTAAAHLAYRLIEKQDTHHVLPRRDAGIDDYLDIVYDIIDPYDHFIVILDDIGDPDSLQLIEALTQSEDSRHTETDISIIATTWENPEFLTDRVETTFQPVPITLSRYTIQDLEAILNARQDAFQDGAVTDSVFRVTAELTNRDIGGQARTALRLLQAAGDLAVENNDEQLTETHVRQALPQVAHKQLADEVISELPIQVVYFLGALVQLTETADPPFKTTDVYDAYKEIVNTTEAVDPIGKERFRQLIRISKDAGVVETRKTSGGMSSGVYLEIELAKDIELTKGGVLQAEPGLARVLK